MIKVEMDRNEKEDLDEYCRHHPELAKTPGEALKRMAGLARLQDHEADGRPEAQEAEPRRPRLRNTLEHPMRDGRDPRKNRHGLGHRLRQTAAAGDERAKKFMKAMFFRLSG